MENSIRHPGIIESIDGTLVCVRILQASACSSCQIASRCHTADAKEKLVNVNSKDASKRWHVGQEVVVSTQASMASKALMIGFAIPLAVMLVVLAFMLILGCGEGIAAFATLFSLVPYYLIVWLLRDRIANQISFKLE